MKHAAQHVRRAGRFGDTELVHLTKRELGYLSRVWGPPTTNPITGLPEYWFGDVLKWIAPVAVPAITEAIGGSGTLGDIGNWLGAGSQWASTVGSGALGALTGAAAHGLTGGDALLGALTGGLSGAIVPTAGGALGFEMQPPFNIGTLFDVASMANGPAAAVSAGDPTGGQGPAFLGGSSPLGPVSQGAQTAAGGVNWGKILPALAMAGLAAAGSGGGQQQPASASSSSARPQSWVNYQFPTGRLERKRNTKDATVPGEYNFFEDNRTPDVPISAARGGYLMSPAAQMGHIRGPGDGRADVIPANVSNDEYVLDAETMALLGNGSPAAGAKKMDMFRKKLRTHKGGALAKGRFSPDAKSIEGYL